LFAVQEVRLDSSFPHEFKPETSPAAAPGEKENGNEGIADRGPGSLPREALETIGSRPGSQMHHLLDALQQRIASYSEVDGDDGCNDVLCKYQLVYQPAMSMHDRSALSLSHNNHSPTHPLLIKIIIHGNLNIGTISKSGISLLNAMRKEWLCWFGPLVDSEIRRN
jgi:hypothetical protein